tara:strand:- start:101 stop:1021 length:921 start_codon:yes stop_codon:yes gene_type:complete
MFTLSNLQINIPSTQITVEYTNTDWTDEGVAEIQAINVSICLPNGGQCIYGPFPMQYIMDQSGTATFHYIGLNLSQSNTWDVHVQGWTSMSQPPYPMIELHNVSLGESGGNGMLGDVNLDGTVNIVDIVNLVGHVLGSTSGENQLVGQALANADYNGDGVVNIVDIVGIIDNILNPQAAAVVNNRIRQMGNNRNMNMGRGRRGRGRMSCPPGQHMMPDGTCMQGAYHGAPSGRNRLTNPVAGRAPRRINRNASAGSGRQVNRHNQLTNSSDSVRMIKGATGNKYVKTSTTSMKKRNAGPRNYNRNK